MAEPTTPQLPSELPVLPIRRTVAFPLTLQPLAVNRSVSVETVNRALASDRLVLLLLQDNDAPGRKALRRVARALTEDGVAVDVAPPAPGKKSDLADLDDEDALGILGRAYRYTGIEPIKVG